jgi:hypothetical protein
MSAVAIYHQQSRLLFHVAETAESVDKRLALGIFRLN